MRIDGVRLWATLMHSATVGATPDGGLCRLALSDADMTIRTWFTGQCNGLGGQVTSDPMGSLFARFPGENDALPPIAIGSHLDTQPTGGRFDGVLGVLAGLEVVRTLQQANHLTRHPLLLVDWTNEEGARFAPAMLASGVWAGAIPLADALAATDADGITLGAELARHGLAGPPHKPELAAYLELHIEQGPVLETAGAQIGVVTGVQGIIWLDVTVTGASCHAGTTPMAARQDPVLAAARMVDAVARLAAADPFARATIGRIASGAGARNTVAGSVGFSLDLRHPTPGLLAILETACRAALDRLAMEADCGLQVTPIWSCAPVAFHPPCVEAVRQVATALGLGWQDIVSGAGHDAVYVAGVAPTAMIFVPCRGGISHHPAETITPAQAEDGANVLLHALLAYDAEAP